ncbi:MAG: hypothetical protein ACXACY_26145 [Candidatus Hodarchaeales archaeon]
MLLSAFHNLPELLLSDYSSHEYYEAYLTNMFAMAILLELNSQNIEFPISRFKFEKKYENAKSRKVDLFVNLPLEITNSPSEYYGEKPDNWIEIKYFSSLARDKDKKRRVSKVSNVGRLIRDILRLCVFTKEEQGKLRHKGRYILLLFNKEPKDYLAFGRIGGHEDRLWLKNLLTPGNHFISIDTENEVKSLKNKILKASDDFYLAFNCSVHSFHPLGNTAINTIFYGYFIYIYQYELRYKNYILRYDAFSKKGWDQERVENQNKLAKIIDKKMESDRIFDKKNHI